jgi:hypothetical protein
VDLTLLIISQPVNTSSPVDKVFPIVLEKEDVVWK